MSTTQASAPGKIILFGEHAVVYGEPAIAAPVSQVRATVTVADAETPGVRLIASDLNESYWLADAPPGDPLARAVRLVEERIDDRPLSHLSITVRSTIPIASGLGSGAATAAALIRALARHLSRAELARAAQVCALAYEVEKIHHGTPSGIDNTVVAYEQPVYFRRQQPENQIETFAVAAPLRLLIADTGLRSETRAVVGDVRRRWQEEPQRFEAIFAACGKIARAARTALEQGNVLQLGQLMNENQAWLEQMTVSSAPLERLVVAARGAGALGAKLSGAGRGGNMIALVTPETEADVQQALLRAGAVAVLATTIR
jgi:mevalonate kinase